jgi:hypothetical protein
MVYNPSLVGSPRLEAWIDCRHSSPKTGRSLKCAAMIAALAGWLADPAAAANSYPDRRAAALKQCEAIDPSEYQAGLAFNPDGYRSMYMRSKCFQEAAVLYRDESLCAQVKERRSLFSSSWGYSAKRCRQLVADGAAADRKALEETRGQYRKEAVKLRDFRLERNGNGRDFDFIPSFGPGYPHGYSLRFELVGAGAAGETVPIAASGFYLRGNENIRIYVPQADIRKRFPRFQVAQPYRVRATLILDVGYGGQSGMWSDAFIERVFPVAERSQSLVKELAF